LPQNLGDLRRGKEFKIRRISVRINVTKNVTVLTEKFPK